jgi:hypothetical protein
VLSRTERYCLRRICFVITRHVVDEHANNIIMDDYQRERIVGRGAYGTVYLCKNKKDSRQVIIKQIPMEQMCAQDRQVNFYPRAMISLFVCLF